MLTDFQATFTAGNRTKPTIMSYHTLSPCTAVLLLGI